MSGPTFEALAAAASRLVAEGHYDLVPRLRAVPGPSLTKAVVEHDMFPIIAEVKRASPSKGTITERAPSALIAAYKEGGAAALSVLTEPRHFRGGLEALGVAAASGLPCLMKDIIVSEAQVEAGHRFGARAVLVIERLADLHGMAPDLDGLIERAHQLGMEVLLEVSDGKEIRRALRRDADLIGVNQRDLSTMRVDASKGARMAREYRSIAHLPLIVMSGIEGRRQVQEMRDAGASGVLVGTALSSSDDPAELLRKMGVER